MKFANYLLPFFLAVSSSSAKDSTPRSNRKLEVSAAAEVNTKSSKASAGSDSLFGNVARLTMVEALVKNFYMHGHGHGPTEHGEGFTLADRQLYVENNPEFLKDFVAMGGAIGIAWTSDEAWDHTAIVEYFKKNALTYSGSELAELYGSLIIVIVGDQLI